MAWFNASTLDVCPVPEAKSCLFLASTIVFDLVCFEIFEANIRSSISNSEGFLSVTYFKLSPLSVIESISWIKNPFKHDLVFWAGRIILFNLRMILFFCF